MKRKVIIIGAGGFAKVVADIIEKNNDKIVGVLDDNLKTDFLSKYKVLGKISDATKFNKKHIEFVIAIGNIDFRQKIANENKMLNYYTAIHPRAIIANDAKIEQGVVICAGSVVNSNAIIKEHTIINANSVIEHDVIIGKYVNIDANSTILGEAVVMAKNHIKTTRVVERKEVINMKDTSKITNEVDKINVLITGKDSYIGLKAKEYLGKDKKYNLKELDMMDETWEHEDFSQYDVVIHVAGIAHNSNDRKLDDLYYKVNRDLAIRTANKAKKEGVKQFVFMSSMIIYGNDASLKEEKIIDQNTIPEAENAYGNSKLQADLEIQKLADDNFKTVIIRTPMVYGPDCKGNFAKLKKLAKICPIFPDIENKRSMIYIYNLCEFYRQAIEGKYSGIYYPQNTEYVSTKEIVKYLAEEQGKKIHFTKFFNPLIRLLSKKVGLINKVFGNKVYSKELTKDFTYNLVENEKSIRESAKGKKKALIVASVASMIQQFNMDNIRLLHDLGHEVDVATNFEDCGNISKEKCNELQEELKAMDVSCFQIDFSRDIFSSKNLKAYKQLKNVINIGNYELIHMHSPIGGVCGRIAARKTRKKNNTRVIYTAHGFHFYKGAPKTNWLLFYPIEKWLSRYTDTIITINQEDYDLAKKKFHSKNVELIHGVGVNPEKFNFEMAEKEKEELRQELGISHEDFVMICIGELNDNKNQIMQIEAMKELVKENNKIKLLLVGTGDKRAFFEQKIEEYNLKENVKLLGYRSDVPKLLKVANLAVSTSRREGLGLNLIEALMSGIPVIASDNRGHREVVCNGQNGILIDCTVEQLAQAIKENACIDKNIQINVKRFEVSQIMYNMSYIYSSNFYENGPLVSVIVPVYNAEKYLNRCIISLVNQTYRNIEIVLINDGSTDNSLKICTEFVSKYSNVKLINKKNGGPSKARNQGIQEATGKYVCFCDSDDEYAADMIMTMVQKIDVDGYDLAIVGYNIFYKNRKKIDHKIFKKQILNSKEEVLRYMYPYIDVGYFHSVCNKLYKRSLLEDNNIKFNTMLKNGEDFCFNLEYIENIDNCVIIDKATYNYYVGENYLSNRYDSEIYEKRTQILNKLNNFYIKNNISNSEIYFQQVKNIYATCFSFFNRQCKLTRQQKKNKLSEMLNDINFKDATSIKYKSKFKNILIFVSKTRNEHVILLFSKIMYIIYKFKNNRS